MSNEGGGFRGRELATNEKLILKSAMQVLERLDIAAHNVGESPESWARDEYRTVLDGIYRGCEIHGAVDG